MHGNLEDLLADAAGAVALQSPRSLEVCRRHGIIPEELYPRSFNSFIEYRGEMQEMVQRRYEHFNKRRLEKLHFLVGERRALIERQAAGMEQHTPVYADPHASRISGSSGPLTSPRAGGILYGDSYDQEQEKIAARMEREALRAQKAEALREQREQMQRQKEMKLAWEDQRHLEALREQEQARLQGIMQNSGRKTARIEHAKEQQQVLAELTEHKKLLIAGKHVQREQELEDRKRQNYQERERKREEKALRAAQVKQRKEEMERARVTHLEGRLIEKSDKAVDFEREKLSQQVRRQQLAEVCKLWKE
eukprot:TRINITY_DN9836_c0_g2_i4.p1 TRINITY_DN9836_c0_g2~~TRINITY_DN9836_c0_g2_i4.p1  ORF type:complete len:320 (+),score=162.33 TRINITY_DN9836_c0_g2_i4:42-962(+)